MLEELFFIHKNVVKNIPEEFKRYLYDDINWNAKAICIFGSRGVGKTTLLLQHYLNEYNDVEKCLYISADNINVISNGLYKVAQEFFKYGGEALIIDEAHKYPNWSLEIKNILDTYKDKKIFFTSSSIVDLKESKYDLSRRVVYYELKGLSFREFLAFELKENLQKYVLKDLLNKHVEYAGNLIDKVPVLKYFKEYLKLGYYPFYLESKIDFVNKLDNIIEKTLLEDLAVKYNIKEHNVYNLKKMLWLISSSHPFVPNIDKLNRTLGISQEYIHKYFNYLELAGLINFVREKDSGFRFVRKPGKIYLENTNLIYIITGKVNINNEKGNIRETFFLNQLKDILTINLCDQGDFLVDDKYVFEVGGKNKNFSQIKDLKNSYLAIENIEIGAGNKIPLYLFGFLY
jgi:uncharacterized protein